jgi:3-dehydroquinate synthase
MSLDKKARGSQLRMVVLDGEGHPGILPGPPEELLEEAYRLISATGV